jgi:hypothetical protein
MISLSESITYRKMPTGLIEIKIRFKYFAPKSDIVRKKMAEWEYSNVYVIASRNIVCIYISEDSAIMFKLKHECKIETEIGLLDNNEDI